MKVAVLLAAIGSIGVAMWAGFGNGGARHLLISDAVAQPMEDGTATATLTIENTGAPDRLIGARAAGHTVTLYSPEDPAGPPVPVGLSALALDAAHLRLSPEAPLRDGSLVPVTLTFAEAGDVSLRVRLSDPAAAGRAAEVGLFGLGDICVVGDGEPAPAISLSVSEDAEGWMVRVEAQDFTFSRDLVGLYHVPGLGHGHVYVGGMKLSRLYQPEARIGPLPPGTHEVRVTLNTNDHRAYVVDDEPVTASATIVVD
ncbi:MAG: hypothetical protein AAGA32_18830 [Pseudomonadota bacterium]